MHEAEKFDNKTGSKILINKKLNKLVIEGKPLEDIIMETFIVYFLWVVCES